MKLIIALVLVTLWSGFATYKWIGASAVKPVVCDNTALKQQVGQLERQLALASQQTDKGDEVRTEVQKVFVPVKETVYEERVVTDCTGMFSDRLREGLDSAVNAANASQLPAANDNARETGTDRINPDVD